VAVRVEGEVCDVLIISFADARAEPYAVVVELHDAVVAQVAVAGPRRAENVATLAKFELEKKCQVHLHVVDP